MTASKPFRLGLTGSIGMGKSTTAQIFREFGVPVHDADAAVHAIYGEEGVAPVEAAFPGVAIGGRIDRTLLGAKVLGDDAAMKRLEAIVHPLVRAREHAFLERAAQAGNDIAVLDIPLLFESGAQGRVDATVVVTAPESVQRARVLARPGMTEEKFAAILARQMPDSEKRRRADYLIDTGHGLDHARAEVEKLLAELRQGMRNGDRDA
ncbi:dephospho-CoA kinase [Ancylobacter novellus DSM 506]|uniref:Dephospho-CoA kinase n=1 Tax=Ancylobacter novellus (strain ATCC 8093 / DSM 506 / JCM 20403 / CCM 1077 / IAM 12100 / NBRC 12443 / NCIMB 10456) TaxID=639283 RepID=D6ZYW6_ANCN5|nr:dephospho-CoA kinase [Ancylobacter novellus]ADH91085.1 dephospho-CoA kinase [Ancylobacter novellus DSM 506]